MIFWRGFPLEGARELPPEAPESATRGAKEQCFDHLGATEHGLATWGAREQWFEPLGAPQSSDGATWAAREDGGGHLGCQRAAKLRR